ncbi:hypothetical protein, partial [Helicobacter felis]|uniref:hypothetical protein n=1 Tax=Helicobacter felis TaxID=214 RepID=UPI001F3916C6
MTLHLPLNSTCTKISFADKYPHLDALAREQKNPLEREFASFVASNWGAPMRNNFFFSKSGTKAGKTLLI